MSALVRTPLTEAAHDHAQSTRRMRAAYERVAAAKKELDAASVELGEREVENAKTARTLLAASTDYGR